MKKYKIIAGSITLSLLCLYVRGAGVLLTPENIDTVLPAVTSVAVNAAGLIDHAFGGGVVVGPVGTALAVALEPNGSVLIAGTNSLNCMLARFTSAGAVDPSFNGGNVLIGPVYALSSVLIQPDGKIIAAGESNTNFLVTRYNADGSIDTTFNGGTPITGPAGFCHSAVLQPDGKIVLAGGSNGGNFLIIRYNPDGIVDPTFNLGNPVTGPGGQIHALLLQSDGKLVAAGASTNVVGTGTFVITRYNADGSADANFNGGGAVTQPTGSCLAAALQQDGKIIAAGTNPFGAPQEAFRLTRYNADGSLDTSFGVKGIVDTASTAPVSDVFGVCVQADGKIVAVGRSSSTGFETFCLARYLTNGTLDSSFGTNGLIFTPNTVWANAVTLQPDGKIIAVGTNNANSCLVRYTNPFTLASFNASYGAVGLV